MCSSPVNCGPHPTVVITWVIYMIHHWMPSLLSFFGEGRRSAWIWQVIKTHTPSELRLIPWKTLPSVGNPQWMGFWRLPVFWNTSDTGIQKLQSVYQSLDSWEHVYCFEWTMISQSSCRWRELSPERAVVALLSFPLYHLNSLVKKGNVSQVVQDKVFWAVCHECEFLFIT